MLRRHERGPALAVLLALLIALAIGPGVGWADDDDKKNKNNKNDNQESGQKPAPAAGDDKPDLKMEYVGFYAPGVNKQLIKFRITNVGKGSSTATKARVVTSTPEPTPWLREIDVPVLAPGASTEIGYPLAADCNGHIVRALVNVPLDSNTANNFVEQTVCPTGQASKPQGAPSVTDVEVVTAINGTTVKDVDTSDRQATPEHMRKGEHVYYEYPSVLRRHGITRTNRGLLPFCFDEENPDRPFSLGFRYLDNPGCDINAVYQLVVDFDLTWLHDVKAKLIFGASLAYGEDIVFEHFNDAAAEAANGTCIGQVGLAPRNWPEIVTRQGSADTLTPTLLPVEPVDGEGSYGSWAVTREIQQKVAGDEFFGFVVHPPDASLDAESDSGCLSHLDNLRLRLHYVVL